MRQVPERLKGALRSIFLITFLDEIALTSAFPVLTFLCFDRRSSLFPFFMAHGSGAFWYGILSSLPMFVAMLIVPLLAWLSDGVGRKRILVIASIGAIVYSLLVAWGVMAGSVLFVVAGFIVCGLCVRVEPIALAIVADESHAGNKRHRMGLLQFWISAGAFAGPIMGGFFAERYLFGRLNFSLPFIIGLMISVVIAVLVIVFFRETHRPSRSVKGSLIETAKSLMNARVLTLLFILLLTQFSWRLYYQFIPPVLKVDYHYSATMVGIFIACVALWLAIASTIGIRLLGRFFNARRLLDVSCWMLLFGLMLTMIACLLKVGLFAKLLIWVAACPIAVGDVVCYIMIITLLSDAVPESDQGKMMGLNYIIVSVVWAGVGPSGGALSSVNVWLPILVAPTGVLLWLGWGRRLKVTSFNRAPEDESCEVIGEAARQ